MESWITELAVLKTRGTAGLETLDQELQPWSRARPSESCLRAVADLILPSWSKVAEDRLPVHTNLLQQANLRMHEELAEQKAQDLELKAMEREEELTRKVTKMRSAVTPPATEAGDEEAQKEEPQPAKAPEAATQDGAKAEGGKEEVQVKEEQIDDPDLQVDQEVHITAKRSKDKLHDRHGLIIKLLKNKVCGEVKCPLPTTKKSELLLLNILN